MLDLKQLLFCFISTACIGYRFTFGKKNIVIGSCKNFLAINDLNKDTPIFILND